MIFGERVLQAREVAGLTQTELAKIVTCGQPTIAKIEADLLQPSRVLFDAIADRLGFPPSWFEREPVAHFPIGSLQFRAKAAKTKRQLSKPYYVARTIFEVVERLRSRVTSLPVRLHRDIWNSSEDAAHALRSDCGFAPTSPLNNVIRAIERLGVVVVGLPINFHIPGLDGFSTWTAEGIPVICLSLLSPGDRLRYTAAHELGELALNALPPGDIRHDAADAFAGEFLVPRDALKRELITPVSLMTLGRLKPRWGVSIAMLIMRAAAEGIISPRHQRSLFADLSARGWRKSEPANLAVESERPRVFRKMLEVVYGDPIDFERFAFETDLTPLFARRLAQAHLARPQSSTGEVLRIGFGESNRKNGDAETQDVFDIAKG